LDVSDYESLYSIRFQEAYEGNCFVVAYEIDFDIPENSYENIEANGFMYADIFDKIDIDRWTVQSSLLDTSRTLTNELPLIDGLLENNITYFRGIMFAASALEMPTDQTMSWNLSYNSENMMTDENGYRYYNVFLRSTINRDGTKSKDKIGIANAYEMKYFMEDVARKEKSMGTTTIRIRFNYASAISEDGQITWAHKDAQEVPIEYILPEG